MRVFFVLLTACILPLVVSEPLIPDVVPVNTSFIFTGMVQNVPYEMHEEVRNTCLEETSVEEEGLTKHHVRARMNVGKTHVTFSVAGRVYGWLPATVDWEKVYLTTLLSSLNEEHV